MPVRNGGPFLAASVSSILTQTFSDFEFVILDDASRDDSWAQLQGWAARDRRICLHRSTKPLGPVGSSNAVIGHSHAAAIARMDADDISQPDRLARQCAILQARPEVAVVGTLFVGIDKDGRVVRPADRWRLVGRHACHPFPHGSAMFRRDRYEQVGGYRDVAMAEDLDLFRRMALRGPIVTIAEALYQYRYHMSNTTVDIGRAPSGPHGRQRFDNDFMAAQAVRLWAGGATRGSADAADLANPTLRRAVYASWGRWHPASLRAVLRGWIRVRDQVAGLTIESGQAYPWRYQ
jgi:glycosyltransferase involved in cell wall biosynthesis